MKIGILGTRGIPNEYGGFEQFAEIFSVFAQEQGNEVVVYCSSLQSYKESTFKGVRLVHCYDPENRIGTAGQFIYDLNCILHARKQSFDILLQLGYTSSAIWNFLYPRDLYVMTNVDGMEWKRAKYNALTKRFLKFSERLVVNRSNALIADSRGIADYLQEKYHRQSLYLPYGADVFSAPDALELVPYGVKPFEYNLLIARMEPENNIEMIIRGHLGSGYGFPLIIVGNTNNRFGKKLKTNYESEKIRFVQGIYDAKTLNNLRHFSSLYFHGHSVGGTNPSLLEAMGAGAFIVAHNNAFNASVLEQDALYFTTEKEIKDILNNKPERNQLTIERNLNKIRSGYNWEILNNHLLNTLENLNARQT